MYHFNFQVGCAWMRIRGIATNSVDANCCWTGEGVKPNRTIQLCICMYIYIYLSIWMYIYIYVCMYLYTSGVWFVHLVCFTYFSFVLWRNSFRCSRMEVHCPDQCWNQTLMDRNQHQTVDWLRTETAKEYSGIQHSVYFSFISKHIFSSTDRCTRVSLPWLPESSYVVPAPAKDAPPNSAETRPGHKKSS